MTLETQRTTISNRIQQNLGFRTSDNVLVQEVRRTLATVSAEMVNDPGSVSDKVSRINTVCTGTLVGVRFPKRERSPCCTAGWCGPLQRAISCSVRKIHG